MVMKELVSKLCLSLTDKDKTGALADIIKHINAHPLELEDLKLELKSELVAARWEDGKDVSCLYTIMKGLDYIPQKSSQSKLPMYVYRGDKKNPFEVVADGGFKALGKSKNIIYHKSFTCESLYVSTSKSLHIALEFAHSNNANWVYKIKSNNGICTNDFLTPVKLHQDEDEVVFPYEVQMSQIDGVAIVADLDSLATAFFPLNAIQAIEDAMRDLGISK